ncbi:MAG: hypothetical protein LBJ67_08155 [Planctomycetaceae bacterium]|jgi:hypothetical protein|nr:hypothetical protein [Planctomycetaceae bacterium]
MPVADFPAYVRVVKNQYAAALLLKTLPKALEPPNRPHVSKRQLGQPELLG